MGTSKRKARAERKRYPRLIVEVTPDEYLEWKEHVRNLDQTSAARLRKLMRLDLLHRSTPA